MTSHLPECLHDDTIYGLQGLCVCDALRACEQRGLDAARNAVAATDVGGQHFWSVGFRDGTAMALAAIDALRGSGNPDTPPSAEKEEKP